MKGNIVWVVIAGLDCYVFESESAADTFEYDNRGCCIDRYTVVVK